MFELEGTQIDTNDYKMKKVKSALASKEAEIKALKSRYDEDMEKAQKKIEALEKSVMFYKKRYSATRQPRTKLTAETKADKAQGIQETVGEISESPPISP